MLRPLTVVSVLALVLPLGGCSDDGIVPQSTAAGSTSNPGTDNPTTSAADSDAPGDVDSGDDNSVTDSAGTTAGSDAGGSTGDEPGASSGDTGSDPAGTDSGSTGSGGSDSGGTDSGSGSSSSGDVCEPIADGAAIGQDCSVGGAACPSDYTCQPFSGIIFAEECQILCEEDCDCPAGTTCNEISDNTAAVWYQCS